MESITSRKNPLILEISKLKMKKYRDEKALFIVEGKKLFSEAVKAGLVPKYVFLCDDASEEVEVCFDNCRTFSLTRQVYEKITTEKSPQGIMGVFPYGENIIRCNDDISENESFNKINEVFKSATNGYIIIENVQDPGNVGTIIRTALAFGIDAVLCVDGADVYNPKTMRAAMGALFGMKTVICRDIFQAVNFARKSTSAIYAAALDKTSISIDKADFSQPRAVMIGNEGNGLTAEALSVCDSRVIIPISDKSESLNAGIAAAVFMDHMRRH
ncbi:MAG: RNA methyltransferase [Ruminococcaceae bacterium]|nr:RNA methyltransferase [Oscillospiraceae bacterium]